MSRSLRCLALVLGSALALTACAEPAGEPESASWPEGTAFALGPIPIARAELEAVADSLAVVNPVNTRRSLRREALVAQLLPRAAARLEAGEEVERSRMLAELGLAVLRGERDGAPPEVHSRSGFATDLGFDLWSRARLLEPGSWQGPFEGVGNWFVLRVLPPSEDEPIGPPAPGSPSSEPQFTRFRLEWAVWTFVPPDWGSAESDELCRRHRVRAIQSELADLVPFAFKPSDGG